MDVRIIIKGIILISLCFSYKGFGQQLSCNDIRLQLEEATLSESTARNLLTSLEEVKDKTALITAFQASANGILCLHVSNPVKRIKIAKEAVRLANSAVEEDNNNLEIRFIRFAIESQIPKVLGMSSHVKTDRQYLLSNFNQTSFQQIPYRSLEEMLLVMEDSNEFTDFELLKMKAEVYTTSQ